MAKVFGIGLASSGSETLAACLRQLKYSHADPDPLLAKRVLEEGDLAALDEAASQYDSFAGPPWALFYRRLDRHFPDARFILTVPDSTQAWFGSLRRHAVHSGGTVSNRVYGFSRPVGQGDEYAERHARQVQEYFAGRPDRLLVLCWAEERSWQRLCDFLGEPVPHLPLPHEHQRRAARVSGYFRRVRNVLRAYAQRLFPTGPS